jgi:hypothetical protein
MARITIEHIKAFRKATKEVFESGKLGDNGLCFIIDDIMYKDHGEEFFGGNFSQGYKIMKRVVDDGDGYIGPCGQFTEGRQTLCCLIMALSNEELLEVVNASV